MTELQGTDYLFRRWLTGPASPKAVFLLVHGMGAHTARWEFLAGYLAANGYASYAPELRGYGRTPERPRGHVDSFKVWDRDILALREMIERDFPGKKVFLLGESMGGLIAFDLAGRHADKFAGAVLISPAFKNGMKFPLSVYLKFVPFLLFNPKHMVDVPFTSEAATRDLEYAAVMNANPDELRVASLKLLAGFMPVQARAGRLARKVHGPRALPHSRRRSPRRREGQPEALQEGGRPRQDPHRVPGDVPRPLDRPRPGEGLPGHRRLGRPAGVT